MGVGLYSNAPFSWASADSLGFIRDCRWRFRVCVACGGRFNHICKGKMGVRISRTIFKYSLKLTFCCWKPC